MRKDEIYVFSNGSHWIPNGEPKIKSLHPEMFANTGVMRNPADWDGWGKPTKATLFVGLKTGRETDTYPVLKTKIPPRSVYGILWDVRMKQVGERYGSSFIEQMGHYIPPEATKERVRIEGEEKFLEPSMQIIIFPAPEKKNEKGEIIEEAEKWGEFKNNIKKLVNVLLDELAQKSVIVEYMKDGEIQDVGQWVWKA